MMIRRGQLLDGIKPRNEPAGVIPLCIQNVMCGYTMRQYTLLRRAQCPFLVPEKLQELFNA